MRYVSGTKLDDRIVRTDWDPGFEEGRQFGRGRSGGQVRTWECVSVVFVVVVVFWGGGVRGLYTRVCEPGLCGGQTLADSAVAFIEPKGIEHNASMIEPFVSSFHKSSNVFYQRKKEKKTPLCST